MLKHTLSRLFAARSGIAVFVAMLMSMSLAVIAMSSMARISESAHTTGKSLQERRLLMYAQSAANIVNGKIQELIDAQITHGSTYKIEGAVDGALIYYPRYIYINPDISGTPTVFGYRAEARLMAVAGDTPPGFKDPVPVGRACYDIVIDVREVIYTPGGPIDYDDTSDVFTPLARYFLGKMKTVGIISCFEKG
jgi:hypothetical protein